MGKLDTLCDGVEALSRRMDAVAARRDAEEPWTEGYVASSRGKDRGSCPYPAGSSQGKQWAEGWDKSESETMELGPVTVFADPKKERDYAAWANRRGKYRKR